MGAWIPVISVEPGANFAGGDTRPDIGIAHVGLDTPEGKRERDQCQETLGDPAVVANEFKHALKTLDATKANCRSPLSGGEKWPN